MAPGYPRRRPLAGIQPATLNEDRGPWPPVILEEPERALRRERSTKTGGHGPRLSRRRASPVSRSTAQRRPGAMAPGYRSIGSRTSSLASSAQRRPGAMAPGYRCPSSRSANDPPRSTKTGGHGPRLCAGGWQVRYCEVHRSTKTGGHGPRLSGAGPGPGSPRGALNEDRGPWPPVIRLISASAAAT